MPGSGGQDGTPRKIRAEGLIQRGSRDVLQRAGEAQPECGGSTAASRGVLTPSGWSATIVSSSSAVLIDSSLASRPAEGQTPAFLEMGRGSLVVTEPPPMAHRRSSVTGPHRRRTKSLARMFQTGDFVPFSASTGTWRTGSRSCLVRAG